MKHRKSFLIIASFVIALLCLYMYVLSHKNNTHYSLIEQVVGNRIVEIRGRYTVVKNYIKGEHKLSWNETVTLTTQASPELLHHLIELSNRWDGYFSVAIYVPGDDFTVAINIVQYLRKCFARVRRRVDWHLVFDTVHHPKNLNFVNISHDNLPVVQSDSCSCSISLSDCLSLLNLPASYRHGHSLTYPINVLRNVARTAKTKYILSSDIELYPSLGIVQAFLNLVAAETRDKVPQINSKNRHVYMLPIFEVKKSVAAPRTKQQLIDQFHRGDAIFFHSFICDECQNFPGRSEWINQVPKNHASLGIFNVTKRTGAFRSWEPIYIGTNDEPFYDERFTWEGKLDKMSQMYEMCLLDYDILVLDNAFLHW